MYALRELCKEDIPFINRWRNDPELVSTLGAPFRFINPETEYEWFERYMKNRGTQLRCAIVKKDRPELPLGLISLTGIDAFTQCAEIHAMIGLAENRGKGLGTFAYLEMLRHAFCQMNLKRVELSTLSSNEAVIRLYKRLGFREEGVKREAAFKEGRFVDVTLMAMLARDYFEMTQSDKNI